MSSSNDTERPTMQGSEKLSSATERWNQLASDHEKEVARNRGPATGSEPLVNYSQMPVDEIWPDGGKPPRM